MQKIIQPEAQQRKLHVNQYVEVPPFTGVVQGYTDDNNVIVRFPVNILETKGKNIPKYTCLTPNAKLSCLLRIKESDLVRQSNEQKGQTAKSNKSKVRRKS